MTTIQCKYNSVLILRTGQLGALVKLVIGTKSMHNKAGTSSIGATGQL